MAGSVNKVIVLGNLGAKPELKYLPSGQAVCEMRIATTETYTDRQEQKQERTEWHRVVVWGKMAENCAKYLDKGRQVYVEGRLQTRSWDDKEGKKQYMTETVANQVVFLGGGQRDGGGQSQGGGQGYGGGPAAPASGGFGHGSSGDDTGGEDDIPF